MNIQEIISKMSLKDKIALCSGESFWETKEMKKYDIPSMFMCDGPHGLRKQGRSKGTDMLGINESEPATCFPTAVTTASSWDKELLEKIGQAIGEEARTQGSGLVLGPGANIKRNPLCGRNFEYFSEDPYLAGKLAASCIKGVQKLGIGTSLKHFAFNNQEYKRFQSDSIMDERTMREIYLSGFETAVKEGKPATIMCAYNKINGTHCSDSKMLLTDILRSEWGFDGMVVTDWGAMNDRMKGFKSGCDLNMPGGSAYMEKECLKAVKKGTLSESDIYKSVERILKLVLNADKVLSDEYSCDYDAHHELAVLAAQQGAVLLKNDGILPINEEQSVAIIGHMAKHPRYQGAGSSHINPTRIVSPLEAMPDCIYAAGCDEQGDTDDSLLQEATSAAEKAQVAVVFAGLPDRYESEGFDRDNMEMPDGHIRMIETVASANPNTVVVLMCGSAVECPWADKVKGILYLGLGGQGVGTAAANLLYGKANPCGKLAESWPVCYNDCASSDTYDKQRDALYMEGIYVGYRYYEKAHIPVRWSFGHGLSYTTFSYSDLNIDGDTVTVTVTNTGNIAGSEVVQLYIAPPQDGIHRPVRELKDFCKVYLQPGECTKISFTLNDRSFAVWNDGWKIPEGDYRIEIDSLSETVHKDGDIIDIPQWQKVSWYENPIGNPKQAQWEAMLGRSYSPPILKKGQFTMDNSVMEMRDYSWVMRAMYWGTENVIAKGFGGKKDYSNPEFRMLMESSAGGPLRSMQISGGMKGGLFEGLLAMANGHFIKGLFKMLK